MATLTETAYFTRRTIKYGSVGLVVFLILYFAWGIGSTYWRKIHPSPPPPPTVSFGKLSALSFPKKENLPSFSYRLETIEGTTPKLASVGRVYFMPKPAATLLGLDFAREMAKKIGFLGEPTKVSDRVFRFLGQNTNTILEMDIISQKFSLFYDFQNDQSILAEKKLPSDEQAVMEAKNFLRQAELLPQDLEEGQAKVSYFRFVAPNLMPALSLSEADFVRVDLFRVNLDDWKILPPNPAEAQVSFLFSGSRELGKRITRVDYNSRPISFDNPATYPLKTSQAAWQELGEGKGYIASLGNNQDGRITVRKIYLAYYEPDTIQDFLQPIFVFEGDNNFVAYVPAVDPQWTE